MKLSKKKGETPPQKIMTNNNKKSPTKTTTDPNKRTPMSDLLSFKRS